jgi:hypothetical protein
MQQQQQQQQQYYSIKQVVAAVVILLTMMYRPERSSISNTSYYMLEIRVRYTTVVLVLDGYGRSYEKLLSDVAIAVTDLIDTQ